MTKILSYVSIICSKPANVIDEKIKLLVNAGVDCYVNEKHEIVVHPDQWIEACVALSIDINV